VDYALRMSKKKRAANRRYTWRDQTGRLAGVPIADPVVKPRTVTVEKIRKAVRDATADRDARHKRSA